ncbi:S-adenosyl-L-methionine-dependent methyltransferase [Blakeslea trispora]|nr:S-adenosyl-L-methionine-dependent methyltransferase [Blakeslea trispora]
MTTIIVFLFNQPTQETQQSELYGLRNLLVNLELPPKSAWFNMGLWNQPNLTYSQACQNLVCKVTEQCSLQSNSSILDVGFGCGDSCFFLAEHHQSKVKGITNEQSQLTIASKRMPDHLKENVSLVLGSADDLPTHTSSEKYDVVLSIDSAYHFNTRCAFLKNAFDCLKEEGGKIGLYDLAIDLNFWEKSTPFQKQMVQWICTAVHIPVENLVTVDTYQQQLKEIGYNSVQINVLEREQVFGGLSACFQKQHQLALEHGIGISFPNRMFLKASSFFFGLLNQNQWVVPIIVTAERRK